MDFLWDLQDITTFFTIETFLILVEGYNISQISWHNTLLTILLYYTTILFYYTILLYYTTKLYYTTLDFVVCLLTTEIEKKN